MAVIKFKRLKCRNLHNDTGTDFVKLRVAIDADINHEEIGGSSFNHDPQEKELHISDIAFRVNLNKRH